MMYFPLPPLIAGWQMNLQTLCAPYLKYGFGVCRLIRILVYYLNFVQ